MLELSKRYLNTKISDFSLEDTKKLQNIIKYHSDLYYNKENPVISDFEYDQLLKKLSILEEKYNLKLKQSSLIWADIWESTFKKVKHSRPMISLGNTYNEEDLNDFNDRVKKLSNIDWVIEYILEFKFDGLGVELIYEKWKLIQAITRWNWVEGEDVTINVMQIDNIPKEIPYKKHLEVRGEVVMPISVFNNINEQAKKEWTKIFSNPRNSASWSLRMKDASITKKRKLQFFAYDLANFEEFRIEENIVEYYEVIKDLEKLWFDISSYFNKLDWISEVIKAINNFWDIKKTIDFEIDWLVLKVNNISLWKTIGFTEHHPRYAISYKFPAEIFTTKILSIDHQVWRTWTITPVANLEPVNMWGAIIKRATLHNYEEVENLDIKIWDTVFIKRAWEVIPKIISVVKSPLSISLDGKEGSIKNIRDSYESIMPPKFCPSCKTEVIKDIDKVRYYCPNDIDCPAKHHEKLTFAVGKQWFNIDWLWERQIELFLNEWIIHNLVDIFKIAEKRKEILELEWFKEKSVNNLIDWVEKAKHVDIATLITALWIAWVGKKTAKTLSKLITWPLSPILRGEESIEKLEELDDIWPEIAKNVIIYFNTQSHKRVLQDLISILDIKYYENKIINSSSIFTWKKVCITWGFEQDGKKISRDELVLQLEEIWGSFVWSVSKNTDFLLAWSKAGSKKEKADKLWIKTIDLLYFYSNI